MKRGRSLFNQAYDFFIFRRKAVDRMLQINLRFVFVVHIRFRFFQRFFRQSVLDFCFKSNQQSFQPVRILC